MKFKLCIILLLIIQFSCSKEKEEKIYKIGETGPAGGVIIYSKATKTDDWQYLEVASKDIPVFCLGSIQFTSNSGTDESIGAGKNNTMILFSLNQSSGACYSQASNFESNGFSDWYLPSREELKLIYLNKNIVPNLELSVRECKSYWCSSLKKIPSSTKWLSECLSMSNGEFFSPIQIKELDV